jgi:hypothetical protein
MNKFLAMAPNNAKFLPIKVTMIVSVNGILRKAEILNN